MKQNRTYLGCAVLGVLISLLVACDRFTMPASSGRPYEMLVVVNDQLWKRPAGRALFNVLDTDVPGLPQPERSFRISQTDPTRFSSSLNIFRNIICVEIDSTQYTQTKMKFSRDVFSYPQIILTIQSPNEKDFAKFVKQNAQNIIDFWGRVEINRLANELEKKHSEVVSELAQDLFHCQLWAPEEIKSYKKGKDFFWASSNTASGLVNICMYTYPYEGPQTFNKRYVLAKRDSVMKANIPGEEPGMYMATDTLCTTVKPIVVRNEYAFEIRGLWKMEHDAMGGPFVSHSRVDTLNNRVVVAEGFVYAPEKMKRGLIRRLEGSLYTLCLPGEQAKELAADIPEVTVVAGKEKE
ncbi:MAG: DUF4837 family protein [Paraprevotella sp.]|nr:DUF4837 family protein [Paraprevotella sp.]